MVGGNWEDHDNVDGATNDLRTRRPPLGHLRIGEAENPGPSAIPWSGYRPQDGLEYPAPHRPGFRDFHTPGFDPEEVDDDEVAEMEVFQLLVETTNTTSWGPLRKRLAATRAHIVLAQETKVMIGKQAEASSWALRNGWKMVAAPAIAGKRGGASGGTAIFARSELGVRFPVHGGHVLEEGRAVAAIVEPPACRPVLVVSVYLRDGVGMNDANTDTLNKVGACVQTHSGWQRIIGGDFNVTPQTLAATGHVQEMNARVVAPDTRRGTCRTRWGTRVYDYFVVGQALANGIEEIGIVEGANVKTHTPVQLRFRPRLTSRKKLTVRRPEPLGKGEVYGPLLPPPSWDNAIGIIEEAVRKARWATRDVAQCALDRAYEEFANLAERELEHVTGVMIERPGSRGKRPSFVWRSVLPERKPDRGDRTAATRNWIEAVAREIGGLALGAEHRDEDEGTERDGDEQHEGEGHIGAEQGASSPSQGGQAAPTRGRQRPRRGRRIRPQGSGDDTDEVVTDDWPSDDGVDYIGILDDVIDSLIADFPTEVTDATTVRLQSRAIDIASEAQVIDGASAERRRAFVDNLKDLIGDAKAAAKDGDDREARHALEAWRSWVSDGAESGLRNAHKFTKVPEQWTPTAVGDSELDVLTCDPSVLLDDMRNRYVGKWAAKAGPRRIEWPTREALPRLTEAEVGEASASFAWRTSSTYDGFHPRHWALLSPGAKKATAAICEAIELLGSLPVQISLVTMPLIGKAQGGYRAIGMVAAVLRVWARARRHLADAWEDKHRRSFWSADKGNSPLDTVWRQEVRQEAAVSDGRQGAALLYDLDSFYETIDRDLLLQRARRTNFPEAIVRVCLALYACPRMLALDGALSREVYPEHGIIAGDTMATTLVKVYCVGALDELCYKLPPTVDLDVHIDDLVLTAEAEPRKLLADLPEAETMLMKMIKEDLRCSVSIAKAGLVATTHKLAAELKKRIPTVAGPVVSSMPNLGVDCRAAAPRGRTSKSTKKAARLRKGAVRTGRLHRLTKVLGRRVKTIYAVGIAPATYYGTSVQGMSDVDVKRARRMAVAALPPRTRLRSLATTLLLHQTPTSAVETGPALQHARMVWKAKTQPDQARLRRAGLTHLRDMFERAAPAFEPLVNVALASAKRAAQLGEPEVNAAWRRIRGPLAASAMSLARIGWRYLSPFEWVDDRGIVIQLTASTPAAIADLLRDGHRRALERYVGRCKSVDDDNYRDGRSACADLAEAYLRCGCPKGVTPQQRGAFRSAATGAVMTQSRAVQLGYVTEDVCPLCGRCGDTIFHRVYECEATREDVEGVAPRWLLEEARRSGRSSSFYTSGIFPHPADIYPLPSSEQSIFVRAGDKYDGDEHGDGVMYGDKGLGAMSGSIFVDGSASTSPIRGIARAGCTATEVDAEGNMVREVNMLIPAAVAQTAQAAEHGGILLAIGQLQAEADIFTDCLGAQKAYAQDPVRAADARRKHGAAVLAASADPQKRKRIRSIQWVKAHRDVRNATDARDAWLIRGNAIADDAAKRAAAAHPQPSAEAKAELEFYCTRFPHVAKAIGAALVKFPPANGNLARRPPPRTAEEARERGCHIWSKDGERWRCEACWSWCCGRAVPAYRRRQACPGNRDTEEARGYAQKGHRMRALQGSPPFLFCVRCGGSSLRRAYKLGRPCAEPNASGRQALARVAKGLHPWQAKDKLTGKEIQRGALRGERAFDEEAGRWLERVDGGLATFSSGRFIRKNTLGVAVKHKRDKGSRVGDRRKPNGAGSAEGRTDASHGITDGNETERMGQEPVTVEPMDFDDGCMSNEGFGDLDDHDVFGHGGDLDQRDGERPRSTAEEAPKGPVGDGAGARLDGGPGHMDERTRVRRCTIVRDAEGRNATRELADIWVDDENRRIGCKGDDAGEAVLHDIATSEIGKKRGAYAVVFPGKGIRAVFGGRREADEFLGDWAKVAIGARSTVGTDGEACDDGDGDRAIARCRAASARERLDRLRARVIARGGAETSAPDPRGEGPMPWGGGDEAGPAPATPIVQPRDGMEGSDVSRGYGTSCACRGRIHEECARRVKPRLDEAPRGDGEAPEGGGTANDLGTGSTSAVQASARPAPSEWATGEAAGQVYEGLRAEHRRQRRLHPSHHHGQEDGQEAEGGRRDHRQWEAGDSGKRRRTVGADYGEEREKEGLHRVYHRERQQDGVSEEGGRLETELEFRRDGKGRVVGKLKEEDGGARHQEHDKEEAREGDDRTEEGLGREANGSKRRSGGLAGDEEEDEEGGGGRNNIHLTPHRHLIHRSHRHQLQPAHGGVRRHAGLRTFPPVRHSLYDLRGAGSTCSASPSESAAPAPHTDAGERECASQAGRSPLGGRPQIALAARQGTFHELRHHASPLAAPPSPVSHGDGREEELAADGGSYPEQEGRHARIDSFPGLLHHGGRIRLCTSPVRVPCVGHMPGDQAEGGNQPRGSQSGNHPSPRAHPHPRRRQHQLRGPPELPGEHAHRQEEEAPRWQPKGHDVRNGRGRGRRDGQQRGDGRRPQRYDEDAMQGLATRAELLKQLRGPQAAVRREHHAHHHHPHRLPHRGGQLQAHEANDDHSRGGEHDQHEHEEYDEHDRHDRPDVHLHRRPRHRRGETGQSADPSDLTPRSAKKRRRREDEERYETEAHHEGNRHRLHEHSDRGSHRGGRRNLDETRLQRDRRGDDAEGADHERSDRPSGTMKRPTSRDELIRMLRSGGAEPEHLRHRPHIEDVPRHRKGPRRRRAGSGGNTESD